MNELSENPEGSRCGVCRSERLKSVYETPLMPLGGHLIDRADALKPEPFFPLHYVLCGDCTAFQSRESIPVDRLATENVLMSSVSRTIVRRDHELRAEIGALLDVERMQLVVDIGGSDGTFLETFRDVDAVLVNVEPVPMTAAAARQAGLETIEAFWSEDVAASIVRAHGKADLVTAKQVLEGVPDLHRFLTAVECVLAEEGRVLIEVPYVKDLVEGNFYDLLAHLRKYHFSLRSLERLLALHGLTIERVTRYSDLGGGLRVYAARGEVAEPDPSVDELRGAERRWGLDQSDYYAHRLDRGRKLRTELIELLDELRACGKRIAGFGGGIKASALLNFCRIDGHYLEFVVDNAKHKQGRLMPGVRVPVEAPSSIDDRIDYVLHLAWLHRTEVIELLQPFLERGGRIIVPTPKVEVVEWQGAYGRAAVV